MSHQDLKLPPIGQKSESVGFKLPNDNDLLMQNQTQLLEHQPAKIWDKKTSSCRSKLKRFDHFQTAIDDKYVPVNTFSQKQKKVIENALEIIQVRKKNKDLIGKNDTIVDILDQKKEMFLVTMTHGIIDKEINNLTNQADERSKALTESNKILEADKEQFQQYYEKYKNQTKKIQEQFEKQVQKRLSKQQQIKSKQITVNSLRTEKIRNQQNITSFLRYRTFLNQLPPKQWIDEKQNKKKGKIQEIRQRMKTQFEMNSSAISKTSNKSNTNQFEYKFEKILEEGQNEEVEQVLYNQQMYFKEPSELIQFFNNLEETNLFNIQNAHYAQQKYQELKIRSQEKKQELQETYSSHLKQKQTLVRQLQQLDHQIKQLKKKKETNSSLDEKDSKDIKATIFQQYIGIREFMQAYLNDNSSIENAEPLTLLSKIQICMEKLWEKLCECHHENPKLIKQIRIQFEKNKNIEKRMEGIKMTKLDEQMRKNRNFSKKQPTKKVVGRLDMKRSPPQEKIIIKKIETNNKDLDDDKKYLID